MAKESNRELKKQLTEAREDIQRLMLELGKVNKTANTSYEQSPAYLASQNQIKRLEEQNKALEQKNKRLQEENRKLRSQSEQTIREINSAAEDYRDPVQTAVKFRMLKINLDLAHKEQERLREENRKLREKVTPKHNARGAGRKKNDDAWKKRYLAFCDLVRAGASMEDVIEEMEISRSTYFRFLRLYREDRIAE